MLRAGQRVYKWIALALAVIILILWMKNLHLQAKVEMLSAENNKLAEQLEDIQGVVDSLTTRVNDLNTQLTTCVAEKNSMEMSLSLSEAKANLWRSRFENLLYETNWVINWIKENSEVNTSVWDKYVFPCLVNGRLNVPCVPWSNHFRYEEEADDKIKPIYRFLADNGGDCEDFALFMAAVVRTAAKKGIPLILAREGSGDFPLLYGWYYPGLEPEEVVPTNVYVYCGREDLNSEAGHCIVVIEDESGKKYYVEPQDGVLYPGDPFAAPYLIITADDFIDLETNRSFLNLIEEGLALLER